MCGCVGLELTFCRRNRSISRTQSSDDTINVEKQQNKHSRPPLIQADTPLVAPPVPELLLAERCRHCSTSRQYNEGCSVREKEEIKSRDINISEKHETLFAQHFYSNPPIHENGCKMHLIFMNNKREIYNFFLFIIDFLILSQVRTTMV